MKSSKDNVLLFKLFFVSVIIVLAIFSLFFLLRFFDKGDAIETLTLTGEAPTVIIDPGHGGRDGGASADGVFEKDINLAVALKVRDFLKLYNVDTVLTRESDIMLADDSSKHKKRDDLANRLEIARTPSEPIFVGIHMNKFSEEKYKGLQVFYSPNHPYSEALALILQSNNKEYLEPYNTRSVKRADSSIYLLDRLETPAVLVECGFLSNIDDREKLTDREYQEKLAFVIANSIIEYIRL